MSQTYYLWTSYKGITNKFDNNSGNTFKKWIQLLHRSEGRGNQNYYTGNIGNVSYTNVQVLDEDFYHENSGIPEGRFVVSIPSASDSSTQNLTASARSSRLSMSSFNAKDGLTDEEKANFYGDFAISRGFNREYAIKTSVEVDSLSQGSGRTEPAKQAKVSINDDGNYVNVDDGEFKIRFTRNDENPFEGIGCLFGFMSWPFKEPIYYPYIPDSTEKDFVLKCSFDEDVTDLDSSHLVVTNCTIKDVRKATSKEYWVIFQINEPASGEFTTEYTITLVKDKVTAVNDTNKKNRTQSITYTFCKNNGQLVIANGKTWNSQSGHRISTDFGETFGDANAYMNDNDDYVGGEFIGFKFIAQEEAALYESLDGSNWTRMRGGGHYFNSTDYEYAIHNPSIHQLKMKKLVSGRDGSGNNLLIVVTKDYKLYYCRDGGYNWFKYDGANNYRERQYGYSGLGQSHGIEVVGATYADGIWIICGKNSKIMYSTDGYNFTDTGINITPESGTTADVIFRDVVYHVDRFIVIGTKPRSGGNSALVGYSTDGINWTINTIASMDPGIKEGAINIVTDNSGTLLVEGRWSGTYPTPQIFYSLDSGTSWTTPYRPFGQYASPGVYSGGISRSRIIWGGSKFLYAWEEGSAAYFSTSTDCITWTKTDSGKAGGGFGFERWMITNAYSSGDSKDSDVDGILKVTVSEVMSIIDISLNYFPAELVPQAWWENMLTNTSDIEERKKENDTRRNYLFEKIFEANQNITYFDISTNVINKSQNTVKDTIRVYKKDTNNSFDLNLNTNSDINQNLGYYIVLKNTNDKVNFTNATNDISFNLIRTGTDDNGYATYEIEKTGGTSNFVIDF